MNLTDLLVERRERERKFFEEPRRYARAVLEEMASELPGCRVFLFGSVAEGEATPGSDIDLLIYSPEMPETQSDRAELAASLEGVLGRVHPFELHFAGDEELEWYRRFAELEESSDSGGG